MKTEDLHIHDYEISMLIDSIEHYKNLTSENSTWMLYYYLRVTIRYMTRLIFAIGWSKLRPYIRKSESETAYNALFKAPENYKTDLTEPGKFAHVLQYCSKSLNAKVYVSAEIDLLYNLGKVRNDDAHIIYRNSVDEFYKDAVKVFKEFEKMFDGKNRTYIIPIMNCSDEIRCYAFEEGDNYGSEINRPANDFKWIPKKNHLFYCVTDLQTLEKSYYCLSPFIEVPVYYEGKEPHFRIYECVQNSGYGTPYDTLKYYTTCPKSLRPRDDGSSRLDAEFEETYVEFSRSALFSDNSFDNEKEKIWTSCCDNKISINISSYPGYGEVLDNALHYCEKICPVKNDVLNFCRDRITQSARIVGNGGLGKTALTLYIINVLITKSDYNNLFTNIIFLSAKKKFYQHDNEKGYSLTENKADINSYGDLIKKLSRLCEIEYSDNVDDITGKIINRINNEKSKRFLLIIDDLDSLPNEEQNKINRFIIKFDAAKLKSIITTRDISQNSPLDYRLSELDNEYCELYAKWYVNNKMDSISSWDNWSSRKIAKNFISNYGDGNPLTIQMLLIWTNNGDIKINVNAEKTRNERISYMYSTVQNLMTDYEKIVFELCRFLYLSLDEENKSRKMPVSVLKYLSFGMEISEKSFNNSLKKLEQLRLISISHDENYFNPYNLFILSKTIVPARKITVPQMYDLFWNDIKLNPEPWFYVNKAESNIINCLTAGENDNKFDNVTAHRIFEYLSDCLTSHSEEKGRIDKWIQLHSDGTYETSLRLIQEIENCIQGLENFINSSNDDDFDMQAFNEKITLLMDQLSEMMKSNPDQKIIERQKKAKRMIQQLT